MSTRTYPAEGNVERAKAIMNYITNITGYMGTRKNAKGEKK